jgi:hypothetical protein
MRPCYTPRVRSLLALRPVAAVHRLPPRSEACPLSLRDLLRSGAAPLLPLVVSPIAAVARAALLAAKEARAVVGLAPGPCADPGGWFDAVARAADELAPGLPFFVSGEVAVGDGGEALEQAFAAAHRLMEAGATHLAVDVSAVALAHRAHAASQVAGVAAERELAVECVLPAGPDALDPGAAVAFVEEFEGFGVRADLVGVRLGAGAAPADPLAQRTRLDALAEELGEHPLLRRGPLPAGAAAALRGSRLRACEDGGAALAAGWRSLPPELHRESGAGRGGQVLPEAVAARLEALVYLEVSGFLEALGCTDSAWAVAVALGSGASPSRR